MLAQLLPRESQEDSGIPIGRLSFQVSFKGLRGGREIPLLEEPAPAIPVLLVGPQQAAGEGGCQTESRECIVAPEQEHNMFRSFYRMTALLFLPVMACAAEPCAVCHPKEAAGYARTGMANSIGRPAGQPGGRLRHALSGSRMEVTAGTAGMRQKLERGGFTASYDIDYFVGSGSKGRSYLIEIAGRLFQSPASYYTDRKLWDLSPGFQNERELDFDRPITAECLYCHADRPRRFRSP